MTVVYATHLLAEADLGGSGTGVRDEHGRPLRLIYGFICLDASVAGPDGADLGYARAAALETYRRFLADEDRLTVEASQPFPLRSGTAPWPGARAVPPATVAAAVARPRTAAVFVGTVAVAVLAVLGAGAAVAWHRPAPAPAVCPSAPASAPASARPSPLPALSPSLSPSPSPSSSLGCPPGR
jgi:hypothetical protein